ncbi:MAG: DASH complex subunit dam1 [Candelina mexicana]|nr:MAG: DASH complex subunit dam1 [Candelina mexicana]
MDNSTKRAVFRNRAPSSRPTTPLRPSSRSSLREGHGLDPKSNAALSSLYPLEQVEPAFAELSDSMADLEANFMHLQVMHESLARFSESFASFLYGLNMNAFCVDFPEAPIPESFSRARREGSLARSAGSEGFRTDFDAETTFMTTDTSFVDNPPPASKVASRSATTATSTQTASITRAKMNVGRGAAARGTRGIRSSGLARAKGRGNP